MRNFTAIDVPQRSPEWFAARLGRVTGSTASDMLARTAKGWAADRDNLLWRLVLERMTGRPQERKFTTPAMQDGIDREPMAVAAYEALTGHLVRSCGFLRHDALMAGASLDGYLGDFAVLISIKCRQPKAHAEHVLSGKVPADAIAQMRHELWLTGASDHHYVSFNPDFPDSQQLRVKVFTRAELDVDGYERELLAFLADVSAAEAKLRAAA